MLTIEQATERWRELLAEFKDLRSRSPSAAHGVPIQITRRNDVLKACSGLSREFAALASSAGMLLQNTPIARDIPDEVEPADVWCSLLAEDRSTEVDGSEYEEQSTDGTSQPFVLGTFWIRDAVGVSCTVAREILNELEGAVEQQDDEVDLHPLQAAETAPVETVEPVPVTPPKPEFPPDDEWHFRPGEVWFRRINFGTPTEDLWRILRALKQADGPVHSQDLRSAAGTAGRSVSYPVLRTKISNLRTWLKTTFGLQDDCNPVPSVNKGSECYRLELSLFSTISHFEQTRNPSATLGRHTPPVGGKSTQARRTGNGNHSKRKRRP